MVKVLQAAQLTRHDVETKFGLRLETSPDFFTEWQVAPLVLSEHQQQILDQTQANFSYLLAYPVQEELVKMVVVSPLLSVAGFYQKPFRPVAERTVEVEVEAEDEIVRGKIDILVLNDQLWLTTVEAKGPQFSWRVGLPQTLMYMFSGQQLNPTRFGLITNGSEFIFVKLQKNTAQYGLSKTFSLSNPGNELFDVVSILAATAQLNTDG